MSGQNDQVPSPEERGDDVISAEMMHLLHEGVPLALIADLASPGGPDSPEILAEEGLPDVDWLGERPPSEGTPDDEDADDENTFDEDLDDED
ncbi:hypothetical protein OEB99_17785 [Actinotalea sp. M2MS4P-6]|uniref:hypothetical protein n=1 Tax=Actinotalea sp. M2MS4P-6 TaxID=2983762 RepID=UPI0021E4F8A2|nr:hypothetical protein [Actinotalea sp. M2MS4P-6]MCV2396168.1 hypothetical protein [Actinotalea sp. M2MS4P-6]